MKSKSKAIASSICCCTATLIPPVYAQDSQDSAKPNQENIVKPNIVWFLTEDLSPHLLAMFNGDEGYQMPNLQKLANEGMIYPNNYSNAPVSSAARTTLITGCYAPSFNGSAHRHIERNPLPEGLKMLPAYLREAGYYTYNANKTDYNIIVDKGAWNNINAKLDSWRSRKDKSRPFFLQRSVMNTHEMHLHFSKKDFADKKTKHNPSDVFLQPHTPDTELMRYTYATLYDRIAETDEELGRLIDILREDGELENTIIMFFGDNGGVIPGTKGYTDNIGVQVPLVVWAPEGLRGTIGADCGVVREELVSFIDYAATTLNIAGVDIPNEMDGKPFLGAGIDANSDNRGRESVVCYGDRFDELYSLNRSIRKGDFRYARNYQPYQPQSLFAYYRFKQLAFREWRDIYNNNRESLTDAQRAFFEPQGVEELYDLANDPNELNNLANDPSYRAILDDLRGDMNAYMVEKHDLGFFPESLIHEEAMSNPDRWGEMNNGRIASLIEIADLQRLTYREVKSKLRKAMRSDDDVIRWWALTVCASFGEEALPMVADVMQIRSDRSERAYIRSRAMVFSSIVGEDIDVGELKTLFTACRTDAEKLIVLNDITFMVEGGFISPFSLDKSEVGGAFFALEWRTKYLGSIYEGKSLDELYND